MSAKTVLVTGASRGLGLAIATELLDKGYTVVAVARTKTTDLEKLAAKGTLTFESFDLSKLEQIGAFVAGLEKKHGAFFGLVNNAGIGLSGDILSIDESKIAQMMAVNLHAPLLLTKYVARGMAQQKRGRIVNVASIISTTGFHGLAAYAATKAGLVGMTRSLARELGKSGITVNAVSPGFLETNMTGGIDEDRVAALKKRSPFNRLPDVAEVAKTVSFLFSEAGGAISGTNLVVDLGSTA
jgi:3-oxoacyl-[acyl-carrier protein] reductase